MEARIVLPYAPILVESTRSIGYSFETALADIIDNSIGKEADEIKVNFSSKDPQYVAILDNGTGMSEGELESAMRYGSKSSLDIRDKDDLGRFGLGLKTASLSQCRKLTVITKKHGIISAACWDLDYIIKKKDWSLKVYSSDEIEKMLYSNYLSDKDSGTIVVWQVFDRISDGSANPQKVFDEKIERARNHVSLVFHRFMDNDNVGKRLKIFFNEAIVDPIDPFLTTNPATQPMTEQTLRIEGSVIKVKPYILPYASKVSAKDKKKLGELADLRSKTIEDAFPYGDVYYRLAKDENSVDQTGMGFDEVYKVAEDMITAYRSISGDISTFLQTIDKIDYFVKYPDVVKKIREDYSND